MNVNVIHMGMDMNIIYEKYFELVKVNEEKSKDFLCKVSSEWSRSYMEKVQSAGCVIFYWYLMCSEPCVVIVKRDIGEIYIMGYNFSMKKICEKGLERVKKLKNLLSKLFR